MRLGIIGLPAGALQAAQQVTRTAPAGAPLPGVFELEEIGGSAPRDYLPAVVAGLLLLYAITDKRRGKR